MRASWLASAGLSTVLWLSPAFAGTDPIPHTSDFSATPQERSSSQNANEPPSSPPDAAGMTFEQRVEKGSLGMMDIQARLAAPLKKWMQFLPAIIDSNQYADIPIQIRLQIPVSYYHLNGPDGRKIIESLIDTEQLGEAPDDVRKSVTADMLIKRAGNGFIPLVKIFKGKLWSNLSAQARADLEANTDIWVAESAAVQSDIDMTGTAAAEPKLPVIAIAAASHEIRHINPVIQENIAKHPDWDKVKYKFIMTAAAVRQLEYITGAIWATYALDDALARDAGHENLFDVAATAGQWHFLPDRLVAEGGVNALRSQPPPIDDGVTEGKRQIPAPFYRIAMSSEAMRNLSPVKLDVLRQATKDDLMKEYDAETGYTPFFWLLYNGRADAIADTVWQGLESGDIVKKQKDGMRLVDWIANAGEISRIAHLMPDAELKNLPEKGSLAPVQVTWGELRKIQQELASGKIDKEQRLLKRDGFGHTRAYRLLRSGMLTDADAGKILTVLNLADLSATGNDGDSALMAAATSGFLREGIAPPKLWDEIRADLPVLTKKFKSGDFVLNAWAKNSYFPMLSLVPKDIREALPRDAWLQKDGIDASPFFWTHFLGHEDQLPWAGGVFTVYDLFIEVPSKGNAFMHIVHNDARYHGERKFKKNMPPEGPVAKMLDRFPFSKWQEVRDDGDTALLILARSGLTEHMPQDFRDRITADDLSHVGPYNDTLVMWYAVNYYKPTKRGAASHLDMVRKEELAKVAPEIWTKKVGVPVEANDVPEHVRYTLGNGGFPVLELTKHGFYPPDGFVWMPAAYETQDATGNTVLKEMDRHMGMLGPDTLHRLAKFGLLDKNKIPAYIMAHFQSAEDWTHLPPGEEMSAFDYAVENGQVIASSWGPEGREWTVRRDIPAEKWISFTPSGKIPVIKMIQDGLGDQIPLSILENRDLWTPENFKRVFAYENWKGNEGRLVGWWTVLEQYLDDSQLRDYTPWIGKEMEKLGLSLRLPALSVPAAPAP